MEISALSMLDNCSQGTFAKENIKKKLGIKWQEDWDCNKNIQWKAKYGVHLGNWVTRFPKMLMVKVPKVEPLEDIPEKIYKLILKS